MARGSLNINAASVLKDSNEKVVSLPKFEPEREAGVDFISGIDPTAELICSSRFRIVRAL